MEKVATLSRDSVTSRRWPADGLKLHLSRLIRDSTRNRSLYNCNGGSGANSSDPKRHDVKQIIQRPNATSSLYLDLGL